MNLILPKKNLTSEFNFAKKKKNNNNNNFFIRFSTIVYISSEFNFAKKKNLTSEFNFAKKKK